MFTAALDAMVSESQNEGTSTSHGVSGISASGGSSIHVGLPGSTPELTSKCIKRTLELVVGRIMAVREKRYGEMDFEKLLNSGVIREGFVLRTPP